MDSRRPETADPTSRALQSLPTVPAARRQLHSRECILFWFYSVLLDGIEGWNRAGTKGQQVVLKKEYELTYLFGEEVLL
jgi:hypothetical protein